MKLYTEEQVRKMLEVCILSDKYPDVLTLNDVVKTQTPIQLPSNEQIVENTIKPLHGLMDKWDEGFLSGAKWMRDKIQGGNNE
jgi:hypothetical protein